MTDKDCKIDILRKKFGNIQTGGKGTIRRKKIVVKKKNNKEDNHNLITENKRLSESLIDINDDELVELNNYCSIFRDEFVSHISKGHRRSNRPGIDNYQCIKKKLKNDLLICKTGTTFGLSAIIIGYCLKQLSDVAINQLIGLLKVYCNIIKNKEYDGFNKIKKDVDDNTIIKAYEMLDIDYSHKNTPLAIRQIYIDTVNKTKTDETSVREALRNSFFTIINIYKK
jgi:hypothetical protein